MTAWQIMAKHSGAMTKIKVNHNKRYGKNGNFYFFFCFIFYFYFIFYLYYFFNCIKDSIHKMLEGVEKFDRKICEVFFAYDLDALNPLEKNR